MLLLQFFITYLNWLFVFTSFYSGLSPGSLRRRSEEPTRIAALNSSSGNNRRKSNLEVPKQYGLNVDKRKTDVTQTKSLNVPKTNSVAPYQGHNE
jgi:hypothetical protein